MLGQMLIDSNDSRLLSEKRQKEIKISQRATNQNSL